MAGIYIHIPFCRRACHYCNFHFSTSFSTKDDMIGAIMKETGMQAGYLDGEVVDTIYFGGGTPSALPADDIMRVLEKIYFTFPISSDPELTLEANPDDIHIVNLEGWARAGINRLSIGIQAFQDSLLTKWNRSHDAGQALRSIALAQEAGFHNITCDLIYGDPELTDVDWVSNIRILLDTGIPHISSYALTVEERTALSYQIRTGKTKPLDEEHASRQYGVLQAMLAGNGFEQYEVSNFARPGYVSRHNSRYWAGVKYLGIGPAAHSYDASSRQWNVAHNIRYIQAIESGTVPFELEELTPRDIFNELVMTGLRTSAGIDISRVRLLGQVFELHLMEQIQPFLSAQKLVVSPDDHIRLSPSYFFFADGIAAALFLPVSS